VESHSICTAHLLKRKSPGFSFLNLFKFTTPIVLNFLQYYYATEDRSCVEICRIVNKHLVERVPCWFYGLIILQEQFYVRENFQESLQDFKPGTGISYVSITFRGRQGNVSDNLQMG